MNASSAIEPAHHASQDVGVVAVDKRLARLRHERQGGQALHRGAHRLILVGRVPAEARGRPKPFRFVQFGHPGISPVGDSCRVRQQVPNGDRPPGRHDRRAGIRWRRDGCARVGRNEARDRIRKRDLPLLHQDHDRDAGDRLGLRGDAEDGVGGHAPSCLLVAPSHGALVHHASVAHHEPDRPRHLVRVHVLLHEPVNANQAFRRKSLGASGCC
jgi:hypothetical protein